MARPTTTHYQPSYGQQRATKSDSLRRRTKYLCNHPTGGAVTTVVLGPPLAKPVALWSKQGGAWVLSTVVDKDNLPPWAANYEQFYAKKA